MKDYRISKKKKENLDYILDVTTSAPYKDEQENFHESDTIDVHFADGKVFKGIARTPEELKKINERQEIQVDAGIENLPTFERRLHTSSALAGVSIVAGPIVSTVASSMLTPIFNMEPNPVTVVCAGVTIALCGAIPASIGVIKNLPKVKELRKLKYRNDNEETLRCINKYPNALASLPESQVERIESFENAEDSFGISHVNEFTQQDLETIVANIDREKTFGFQYAKKPTGTSKK